VGPIAVGVDVGQKRDPTAVAVLEVEERPRSADGHSRLDDYYVVRFLERLPLGTPYPDVACRVAGILTKLDERAAMRVRPSVYLDATGVGQPVVDLLTATGVTATPVYFTHGDRCTPRQDGTVVLGKALLVSQLQVLLQSGRVLLPRTMEARVLAEELLNFELRVDEKANESFGAFKVGTHDDLVSALGLAVMAGQRRGHLPFSWYRTDQVFRGQVLGRAEL
jgi:hypothetical protein